MKKWKIICVVCLIPIIMCGCQSKEEREYQRAREAANQAMDAYNSAVSDYYNLQKDIQDYQDAVDRLNGY